MCSAHFTVFCFTHLTILLLTGALAIPIVNAAYKALTGARFHTGSEDRTSMRGLTHEAKHTDCQDTRTIMHSYSYLFSLAYVNIHSFVSPLIHFIHSFIHLFAYSFIHLFFHSPVLPFNHLVHSSIHPIIIYSNPRSFVYEAYPEDVDMQEAAIRSITVGCQNCKLLRPFKSVSILVFLHASFLADGHHRMHLSVHASVLICWSLHYSPLLKCVSCLCLSALVLRFTRRRLSCHIFQPSYGNPFPDAALF